MTFGIRTTEIHHSNQGFWIDTSKQSKIYIIGDYMKIAIVGSRGFPDIDLICEFVDSLPEGTTVISGGAKGVDTIAEKAARKRGLEVIIYPAEWDNFELPNARIKKNKWGREFNVTAGIERNKKICEEADEVIAFWDGMSKGTHFTIEYAKSKSIPVRIFRYRSRPVETRMINEEDYDE